MGYFMRTMTSDVRIPAARHADALAAVRALAARLTSPGSSFSFVDTDAFASAQALSDALRAWRWEPEFDENGGLAALWFVEDKLGDDQLLLNALAPFVEPGSSIVMIGGDDEIWRWRFDGGQVHEEDGRVVFDDDTPTGGGVS